MDASANTWNGAWFSVFDPKHAGSSAGPDSDWDACGRSVLKEHVGVETGLRHHSAASPT